MADYLGGGELKSFTRRVLLGHSLSHFKKDIKYLGLPGRTMWFEEQLAQIGDSIEIQMDGYEWDGEVVEVQQARVALSNIPINLHQGNIHDAPGRYNLAWFDYCGCLDPEKIHALSEFIRHGLYFNGQDDPVIAITLLRGREKRSVWDLIPYKEAPPSIRATAPSGHRAIHTQWQLLRRQLFPELLSQAAGDIGARFVVDRYIEYHETSPMVLLIGRVSRDLRENPLNFEIEKLGDRNVPEREDRQPAAVNPAAQAPA